MCTDGSSASCTTATPIPNSSATASTVAVLLPWRQPFAGGTRPSAPSANRVPNGSSWRVRRVPESVARSKTAGQCTKSPGVRGRRRSAAPRFRSRFTVNEAHAISRALCAPKWSAATTDIDRDERHALHGPRREHSPSGKDSSRDAASSTRPAASRRHVVWPTGGAGRSIDGRMNACARHGLNARRASSPTRRTNALPQFMAADTNASFSAKRFRSGRPMSGTTEKARTALARLEQSPSMFHAMKLPLP